MPRPRLTGCRFIRNGDEIRAYWRYYYECKGKGIKPISKSDYHQKIWKIK